MDVAKAHAALLPLSGNTCCFDRSGCNQSSTWACEPLALPSVSHIRPKQALDRCPIPQAKRTSDNNFSTNTPPSPCSP